MSIHLQICWQVVPGDKFFWVSIAAGWGLPALFTSITLPITGTSYRFGATCHINHHKALADYWGPLLAFAAISTILQFATFGYCIKVYIRSLIDDGPDKSASQASSGELPSHNSRSGSIKTVTAGQAYRRIKKVIALQWRGTAIVIIIIVNVVFLAIVFVQMDNTVTATMDHFEKATPWLLCLILNQGDKSACLNKVKDAGLVSSEPKVMAVILLLSLNGIWAILFLGRTSMLVGWLDVLKAPLRRRNTDFVSVDARSFSTQPKHYEMIMSPQSHSYNMPEEPQTVVTSPPANEKERLTVVSQSPTSHYEDDYFGKDAHISKDAHPYSSPKLSFSTPRPPSAGRISSRDYSYTRTFTPQLSTVATSRSGSQTGNHTPAIEWDPTSTHAKPFETR